MLCNYYLSEPQITRMARMTQMKFGGMGYVVGGLGTGSGACPQRDLNRSMYL